MAIFDGFPVFPGHTLIIPRRYIASFFDATREEHPALFDLLTEREVAPGLQFCKVRRNWNQFPVELFLPIEYIGRNNDSRSI